MEKLRKVADSRDVELSEVKIGYKLKTGNEVFRYTYLKSLDIEEGEDLML